MVEKGVPAPESHGEMTGHEMVDGDTWSPGVISIGVFEHNVYMGFGRSG